MNTEATLLAYIPILGGATYTLYYIWRNHPDLIEAMADRKRRAP